jgi:transcriptional regulator with XRE-family HTH domain
MKNKDTVPDVSALVRDAREKRGMTQDDLADASGLSQSLISQVENDVVMPTLFTLASIARALGCRVKVAFTKEPKGGA